MELHTIGIDLGKTVFHLVGLNQRGEVVVRRKFSCKQLLHFTANRQVKLIRMEACWPGPCSPVFQSYLEPRRDHPGHHRSSCCSFPLSTKSCPKNTPAVHIFTGGRSTGRWPFESANRHARCAARLEWF